MISVLRGMLIEKSPGLAVIDVGGVGYEVEISLRTFDQLPAINSTLMLQTHLHVREETMQLIGFAELNEKKLFKQLLRVSGVGLKVALTILSHVSPDEFVHAIMSEDLVRLTRLPGIGKKTAQRLLLEMRDSVADWGISAQLPQANSGQGKQTRSMQHEMYTALCQLGFKPFEIERVTAALADHSFKDLSTMVNAALKLLGKQPEEA
jgi:Holliday junction DNA helicase RuvA